MSQGPRFLGARTGGTKQVRCRACACAGPSPRLQFGSRNTSGLLQSYLFLFICMFAWLTLPGKTPYVGDEPFAGPVPARRQVWASMQASSGIRTHDRSLWACKGRAPQRARSHGIEPIVATRCTTLWREIIVGAYCWATVLWSHTSAAVACGGTSAGATFVRERCAWCDHEEHIWKLLYSGEYTFLVLAGCRLGCSAVWSAVQETAIFVLIAVRTSDPTF
jgi:hypothetical protein